MWLPRPAYEALPYALLSVGCVLAAGAYLFSEEWAQTTLIVAGSLAAVCGLVLLLKRRDYRMSRSRSRYDRLD